MIPQGHKTGAQPCTAMHSLMQPHITPNPELPTPIISLACDYHIPLFSFIVLNSHCSISMWFPCLSKISHANGFSIVLTYMWYFLLLGTYQSLVLGSPVQSGFLSIFEKTGTETSPPFLKFSKTETGTIIDWSTAVSCGFLQLQDWSEPVMVQTSSQPVPDWFCI